MHRYEPTFDNNAGADEWYPPTDPFRDAYDVVDGEPATRLTHLVLVDGRLVDMWQEAVTGTRWQRHAERFDRQLQPVAQEKPKPRYERTLAWLDDLCGGRAAVDALDAVPLSGDGLDLPETPDPQSRSRLDAAAELLDAVAERWFDEETSYACRRALLHVWSVEPEVVLDAASAAHVAGGIAWVVGKANGLLRPQGDVRVGHLKDALALSASPTTYGKVVERALRGFRQPGHDGWWRPDGLPDLLATGHPGLLVSSVRRRLVRVRDRALEAKAEAEAAHVGD